MSDDDVEIVREVWDAWVQGDLPAVFARYDPDIVWDLTHFRAWPDQTYHGAGSVQQFLTDWLALWRAYEVGVDEILEASDGRVLVLAWQRGKGRQSGLPMEMAWGQISTVRNGKITRIENYDDRAEALEAAGVRR